MTEAKALIEYRVRMIPRYVVTRYHEGKGRNGVEGRGEYDNPDVAYEVGYALCKAEHDRLGWAIDDPRIVYPKPYDLDQAERAGLVVEVSPSPLFFVG